MRYLKVGGVLVVLGVLTMACGPSFELTKMEFVKAEHLSPGVQMLIRFKADSNTLIRFQDFHNLWPKGSDSALLDLRDTNPGRYSLEVWTGWDTSGTIPYPWNSPDPAKPTASYEVDLTLNPEDAPGDTPGIYRLMPGVCEVKGRSVTCALMYEKQ